MVLPQICHAGCERASFPTEIFRLNKVISRESTHFFYSRCNFLVSDKSPCERFYLDRDRYDEACTASMLSSVCEFHRFLCSIGAANRESMRSLEFNFWFEETLYSPKVLLLTEGFDLLSEDHNLRTITLNFQWEPCLSYFVRDEELMEAFSDIRGLDKLKICFGDTTYNEAEFPHETFMRQLNEKESEKISKMVENAQSEDSSDESEESEENDKNKENEA